MATLTKWRENLFAPFEPGMFSFLAPDIRIEEAMEDGQYVVRAELPGLDPQQEIDVSVTHGVVRIEAERAERKQDKAHSEFHYGRLLRTVALPEGAQEDTASAKYTNGILEVRVGIQEPARTGRKVPIES